MINQHRNQKAADKIMEIAENPTLLEKILSWFNIWNIYYLLKTYRRIFMEVESHIHAGSATPICDPEGECKSVYRI
jgi:hypothetical protein